MELADFLSPQQVVLNLRVRDKAGLLDELARRAAGTGPSAETIAMALKEREALGSTGFGGRFALPHARLPGLARSFGLFARLQRPIDYAAVDGEPVDMVFMLLIPQENTERGGSAVAALAAVARRFRNEAVLAQLRRAANPAEAFQAMTQA